MCMPKQCSMHFQVAYGKAISDWFSQHAYNKLILNTYLNFPILGLCLSAPLGREASASGT